MRVPRVVRVLDQFVQLHGAPHQIVLDNSPEFAEPARQGQVAARQAIADWQEDYYTWRPHSALG